MREKVEKSGRFLEMPAEREVARPFFLRAEGGGGRGKGGGGGRGRVGERSWEYYFLSFLNFNNIIIILKREKGEQKRNLITHSPFLHGQ